MKEYIKYYPAIIGGFKGQNIVTVVTIMDEARFGRGVSICSPKDIILDKTGLFHARNYALRAIKGRENILITDERAIWMLIKTECPFIYHSQKWPALTWQEKRFFFGKKFLNDTFIIDINWGHSILTIQTKEK